MGCLKLNDLNQKGSIIAMKDEQKKKVKKEEKPVPNSTISLLTWIIGILATIIIAVVGFIGAQVYTLRGQVSSNTTDISNLKETVIKIDNYLYSDGGVKDQLNHLSNEVDGINEKLDEITGALNISSITVASGIDSVVGNLSVVDNNNSTSTSALEPTTVIGTDVDGKTYIAKDLINETILLVCTEEDKEVYFLGKYNEDYHWDGFCITNSYYLDGSLYGICESNFDDGTRLDYKSIVRSEECSNTWIYSDKICEHESNSGINKTYSLQYTNVKNFTNTNVRITDILNTDQFVEKTEPVLLRYYSGNSIDGVYNDTSGDAFLVINDEGSGNVKTIYQGKFKDGTFDDDSGNAWDIAYSSEYDTYVYNIGTFKNGNAINVESQTLQWNEAADKVKEFGIDMELNWYK